jgi:hypothetical protein
MYKLGIVNTLLSRSQRTKLPDALEFQPPIDRTLASKGAGSQRKLLAGWRGGTATWMQ